MWDQYKRTFTRAQVVIAAATIGTYYYMGHLAARSAAFFVVMQIGAVIGAMWGTRLRRKVDGQT